MKRRSALGAMCAALAGCGGGGGAGNGDGAEAAAPSPVSQPTAQDPAPAPAPAPLPAPLPAPAPAPLAGATLGIIGDSRAAASYQTTGTPPAISRKNPPRSIVGWASFLSRQQITSGLDYNFAVSGSGVEHIGAQLTALQAVTPACSHVYILTGTNSFAAGVTALAAWADLAAALTRIRDAGMQAIVSVDLPRAQSSWTAANSQESLDFNQLVRLNAPGLGALVVDPTNDIKDPVSGDPRPGYYFDQIHPATMAAYVAGANLAAEVTAGLAAAPATLGPDDLYHATNQPLGNVLLNGGITGTSGTHTGVGGAASGIVANGWNNRVVNGSGTSVASIVPRAEAALGSWQQLVQTSAAGVSNFRLSPVVAPVVSTNYPASGSLVLEFDLEVTGAVGLEAIGFTVVNFDGTTLFDAVTCFGSALTGTAYYPYPESFSGRARSEPLPYNAAANQLLVRFETRINNGGATIKVGNVQLRPA